MIKKEYFLGSSTPLQESERNEDNITPGDPITFRLGYRRIGGVGMIPQAIPNSPALRLMGCKSRVCKLSSLIVIYFIVLIVRALSAM